MGLTQRLNAVERRLGVRGPCPTCHGEGWSSVVTIIGGQRTETPGCARCGRTRSGKLIIEIVRQVGAEGAGGGGPGLTPGEAPC